MRKRLKRSGLRGIENSLNEQFKLHMVKFESETSVSFFDFNCDRSPSVWNRERAE